MAHPSSFNAELGDHRLRVIAEVLLDVLYTTELELATELDDGYTRGTTTFGRQRNAIIQLCQSKRYDWLELTNPSMDVTFSIGGIPCRFFADDPNNPRKPGYWRRNDVDCMLFPIESGNPELFRFIVEKASASDHDSEIHFVGYDGNSNECFRWCYSTSTPVLASVDDDRPREVPLPPAQAKPKVDRNLDQTADGSNDDEV